MWDSPLDSAAVCRPKCGKKGPARAGPCERWTEWRLEMHASAKLHEALLALERVAGELRGLTKGRGLRDVAAVAGRVRGVEDVKDFGQHLDTEGSGDENVL